MTDTDYRVARCATCSSRATAIVHPAGETCPLELDDAAFDAALEAELADPYDED